MAVSSSEDTSSLHNGEADVKDFWQQGNANIDVGSRCSRKDEYPCQNVFILLVGEAIHVPDLTFSSSGGNCQNFLI